MRALARVRPARPRRRAARRLAPAALLSVLAPVAVVALPVATPPVDAPHPVRPELQQIPLAGVETGAVRALAAGERRPAVLTGPKDTRRFDTVGVTWTQADGPVSVQVRTRSAGRWTDWAPLDTVEDQGPDDVSAEARTAREGTAPRWVGDADGVQVRVDTPTGRAPADVRLELVESGESDADDDLGRRGPHDTAGAETPQPTIISRAEWGADESIRKAAPSYASSVRVAYVHHTASSNQYSREEAAAQVRGFYAYHVKSLGWSDLGYNFLVDKYGRIYEGRAGGLDSAVIGSHAGGFNTGSVGISMIGTYNDVAPTSDTLLAVERVLAWKLSLDGVDPKGTTTMTSGGGSSSKYPAGQSVTIPTIAGHRDTNNTACPGNLGYAALPALRDAVAKRIATTSVNPIDAKHEALGGDTGLLGPAVAAEKAVGNGKYRDYQRGSIFWAPGTRAREVHGGILQAYRAVGGPTGILGFPTSDETGVPGGRMSAFTGGSVVYRQDTGKVTPLYGAIGAKYKALGGPGGSLGLPRDGEEAVRGGVRVQFDKGHVYWTGAHGARAVTGAILANYLDARGPDGQLGMPKADEAAVTGGRAVQFTGGTVTWSSATGAHRVVGGIHERWAALGGAGALGLATSDETAVGGGARSTFTKGHVYWSPSWGAKALYGGILDKYLASGGATGGLGFPAVEEGSVRGGRLATFARGQIYWSPSFGAHTVFGGIREKHESLGGAAGFLGVPRTDEGDYAGGRRQSFAGGEVLWSPATGAREVHGGILERYLADGGATAYGFPVTDEHDVPGGRASRFQRATITWDAATGAITVRRT